MSSATTLSSLAMLKVSIDSGKDYLEYLRPYVVQMLVESRPEVIDDASIARELRARCGLEIPYRTVHVVLQRLAKDGFLSRANRVYTVIKDLPVHDITVDRAETARHLNAVTTALSEFARTSANREISDDQATDCMVAFLSKFSIPCLRSYLRGTTLPAVTDDADWQVTLVSQFVNDLASKPELFNSFMRFVQGHMLANALLCPDLHSVSKSYKDVTFYFDTPLLIQLLGLEGDQEMQAMKELVGLVQDLDGQIAYFAHTRDELVTAIRGSADFVDSPRGRGTIVDEARRAGKTRSDLLLVAQTAPDTLASMRIQVKATPPYDPKTYKFEISEAIFTEVLSDEVNYHNPRARDHDIQSVRSVYILRRGILPFSIETSRAVLVTNNSGFSKAAYEYGKDHEQSREVSAVITDFSLANTAWLKAPQGAPSLPRKEVLAFAYAANRPSNAFWTKVLAEAEKLEASGRISARDHQLLRSSHHVQSELMKLTLGQDEALTHEAITETLARVSEEIRAEEAARVRQVDDARVRAEKAFAEQLARAESTKKAIYWRCDRKAGREALALSISVWFFQAAVAVFGVLKIQEDSVWGWIVVAVAAASGVLRLLGAHRDIKPAKIFQDYKEWRRTRLVRSEYAALSIQD